jgi:hypothetical protein
MTLEQKDLRAMLQISPFKPFRLHLADGKSLKVPHPDFLLAGSGTIAVATELPQGLPGELNFVPYESIVRVEILEKSKKR